MQNPMHTRVERCVRVGEMRVVERVEVSKWQRMGHGGHVNGNSECSMGIRASVKGCKEGFVYEIKKKILMRVA